MEVEKELRFLSNCWVPSSYALEYCKKASVREKYKGQIKPFISIRDMERYKSLRKIRKVLLLDLYRIEDDIYRV